MWFQAKIQAFRLCEMIGVVGFIAIVLLIWKNGPDFMYFSGLVVCAAGYTGATILRDSLVHDRAHDMGARSRPPAQVRATPLVIPDDMVAVVHQLAGDIEASAEYLAHARARAGMAVQGLVGLNAFVAGKDQELAALRAEVDVLDQVAVALQNREVFGLARPRHRVEHPQAPGPHDYAHGGKGGDEEHVERAPAFLRDARPEVDMSDLERAIVAHRRNGDAS